MRKKDVELLIGDEAVALGALHAGISGCYSYPGTPATEILEYIQQHSLTLQPIHAQWSANEKVAYEEALGVSFVGKRALVSMKHVGLNVAADPFINSCITGVEGGLVLVVADDPAMHSSQNEQDSRYYARFAQIICLEPTNQQEAYDMTREAFDLSEKFQLPVMLRLVTRLAHSRSAVKVGSPTPKKKLHPSQRRQCWTLLPVNARRQYQLLTEKQSSLLEYCESSPYNELHISSASSQLGVIASGIAYNYFRENVPDPEELPTYLKVGTYPLPQKKLEQFLSKVKEALVIEEGYPFIEQTLLGASVMRGALIKGKMSGHLPRTGELTPAAVRKALVLEPYPVLVEEKEVSLPPRPPALCRGCPHADTFGALVEVMKDYPEGRVFSDIGCYTLSALPPYNAIDTCVEMGASVGMAKGASDVGLRPSVAVIGDSTFAHSGITPLLGAARENTDMTLFILDNTTVAMTGGQETMLSGEELPRLLRGLGIDPAHIKTITPVPQRHEENVNIIRHEITHRGLSVIIAARECLVAARVRKKGS